MKILFLSAKCPFPPDEGGRVAVFHLWQELRRNGAEVHLVCPFAGREVLRHVPAGASIRPLLVDPKWRAHKAIARLVRGEGYFMERFFSPAALDDLKRLVAQEGFDAAHVEGVYLSDYARELKREFRLPVVLRAQNIESDILEQYATRSTNPFVRWYAGAEAVRARQYEREAFAVFDYVLPITPTDERRMLELAPGLKTVVVPGAVDATEIRQQDRHVPDAVLLFTNYEWRPNREGVAHFMKEIFPLLRSRRPTVRLLVAGRQSDRFRPGSGDGNVEVCGFVDDLNGLGRRASVAVVPLLVGSGMRMKLLSLMAMGMAVVTTSVGAEGIGGSDGVHYVVADAPADFAAAVDRFLGSAEETLLVGENARQFVEERYSLRSIGGQLYDFYRSVVAESA
jgi:glycosyltransferase involved in cell wall biosynthesis